MNALIVIVIILALAACTIKVEPIKSARRSYHGTKHHHKPVKKPKTEAIQKPSPPATLIPASQYKLIEPTPWQNKTPNPEFEP